MDSQRHFELPQSTGGPPDVLNAAVDTTFSDDLRIIIDTLRRRSKVFLLGFFPVVILALCWIYLSTPLFTASATVVLDPRKQFVTSSPEVLSDVEPDSAVIDTQVELVQSRVVLGRVVDRLELLENPTFRESNSKHVTWVDRLLDVGAIAGFGPDSTSPGADAPMTRNDLIDWLTWELEVGRVGLTYAIRISYTDADPEYAATIANAVADAYLEHQRDEKQQATKDANKWLNLHVSELKEQVESAEAAVEVYRSRSGLLVAKGSTSTESQLTNLDSGLNEARQDLSDAQARLAGYRSALAKSGAIGAAEVMSTGMMQQLRAQYATLTDQQAQMSPTLGPMHPQMVELNRQLSGVQEQMNAEAQRMIVELTSDVTIANNRVAGLLAIRDQSRTQLAEDNTANVELGQLQTSAESLRRLYEEMLARLKQTTAQETLNQLNATIVSDAVAPTRPSRPKATIILVGALGLGVVFGSFAVLLANLFDNVVYRPDTLERRTHVATLALVPELQRSDLKVGGKRIPVVDYVLQKPMSLFSDSFRTLRIAVLDTLSTREPVVIQMASATFAEGKTLSSIAFARVAAMDGKRVLLIDADVRQRSLTHSLGINAKAGLIELLRGKAQLQDVIVPGVRRGTPHVLPLSEQDVRPRDLFSSTAFENLLVKLKRGFDVIVIDSAPILMVAESLSMAKRVDAVVFVAKWGQTPVDVVATALEEINRVGGHVAGTLLTHVDVRKIAKQYYGRGYYPALMKHQQA